MIKSDTTAGIYMFDLINNELMYGDSISSRSNIVWPIKIVTDIANQFLWDSVRSNISYLHK